MKHIRDKQHEHTNEYPNWVMYIGLGASALLSLICGYLTGVL